jgi:hypothetical protein
MPSLPALLDRLLHLGEKTLDAAAAENWTRVAALVEQRAEVAEQLAAPAPQSASKDLSPAERRAKADALADQNERLGALLRERREALKTELARIGEIRQAQDSYRASPPRDGVLPDELAG